MAFKKLKDVVAPMVREDGSYIVTPQYEKSPTIAIHVETTGKLRLLVLIPPFMGELVGTGWSAPGVEINTVREKATQDSPAQWALLGREPEALESAWKRLCEAYHDTKQQVVLEPVIIIARGNQRGLGYRGYGDDNKAAIEVDFDRYLRNTNRTKDRRSSDYRWNDDDSIQPKVKQNFYVRDSEYLTVPYDPVLWARLCALRDQVRAAAKQYTKLIDDGEFVPRLLSGTLPLLASEKQ